MIEPYFTMSDEQMALYKSITTKMTQETLEDLIELLESVRSDGRQEGYDSGFTAGLDDAAHWSTETF